MDTIVRPRSTRALADRGRSRKWPSAAAPFAASSTRFVARPRTARGRRRRSTRRRGSNLRRIGSMVTLCSPNAVFSGVGALAGSACSLVLACNACPRRTGRVSRRHRCPTTGLVRACSVCAACPRSLELLRAPSAPMSRFVAPTVEAWNARVVAIHPQLRDLCVVADDQRVRRLPASDGADWQVIAAATRGLDQLDLSTCSRESFASLGFVPNTVTSGRGLIVAGGPSTELAIRPLEAEPEDVEAWAQANFACAERADETAADPQDRPLHQQLVSNHLLAAHRRALEIIRRQQRRVVPCLRPHRAASTSWRHGG